MKDLLNIEEIAKRFELSQATINYYTNLGLILVEKKKGNKRLYNLTDVGRRIEKIRGMLNVGYTLRLIQKEFMQSDEFGPL